MITLYISCGIMLLLAVGTRICVRVFGEDKVKTVLDSPEFRAKIAVVAGAIMMFTPDSIDKSLVAVLAMFGIVPKVLSKDV